MVVIAAATAPEWIPMSSTLMISSRLTNLILVPRSAIAGSQPRSAGSDPRAKHGSGRPLCRARVSGLDGPLAFCKHGLMSLFITCPVESVERATAFYTALGWTLNPEMSDHNVSCFAIAPEQYVMLGSREMYASVGGVEELVGGPHTPSKVTVSFDLGSREAVDELAERAGAAGGRIGDTDDYPFMYQRQFDDPDGYHYSPFWMKPDTDPNA
jgi:predicted lactoylglutathione lyase